MKNLRSTLTSIGLVVVGGLLFAAIAYAASFRFDTDRVVYYFAIRDNTDATLGATVDASNQLRTNPGALSWLTDSQTSYTKSSTLCVTNTGADGAAVTLTLGAVAASYHYITWIDITRFHTDLIVAAIAPVVVTTTNIPGSMAFSTQQAASAQGTSEAMKMSFSSPIRSTNTNTATTIVGPATTDAIWRLSACYYTGA